MLDLDDIRAEVAEPHRRHRCRHEGRDVQHAYVFERACDHGQLAATSSGVTMPYDVRRCGSTSPPAAARRSIARVWVSVPTSRSSEFPPATAPLPSVMATENRSSLSSS